MRLLKNLPQLCASAIFQTVCMILNIVIVGSDRASGFIDGEAEREFTR